MNDSQKYLSISSWESEEAIKNWRENIEHQQAQNAGKTSIFSKYRIRVAGLCVIMISRHKQLPPALSEYQLDAKGNTDAEYDMGCQRNSAYFERRRCVSCQYAFAHTL